MFQAQSVHEVKAFYQALSLFDRLAYETENHVVYKLKQGKIITLSVSLWYSLRDSIHSR